MRLKIAVQKSGRLSDDSLSLLRHCGLSFSHSKNRLFCYGRSLPMSPPGSIVTRLPLRSYVRLSPGVEVYWLTW